MGSRLRTSLLLIIVTFATFANGGTAPFVFDDRPSIVENTTLSTTGLWDALSQHRGASYLTFAANWRISPAPLGFRIVNWAIHATAGIFFYLLVAESLGSRGGSDRWNLIAGTAAAWWLIHPLQTESVTYIVQRLESLMGCCAMGSMWMLARGARGPRSVWWLAGSWLLLFSGARCKEPMAVMPAVLLWYDFAFHGLRGVKSRRWYYVAMLVLWIVLYGSITTSVVSFLTQSKGQPPVVQSREPSPSEGTDRPTNGNVLGASSEVSPMYYLRYQPRVILHYLRLVFWPDTLCIDYGYSPRGLSWADYGAAALVGAMLISVAVMAWFRPRAGFVCGAFFLSLALRSSVLPRSDLMVEHRMYLPLAVPCLLVSWALAELAARASQAVWVRRGTVVVVVAVATGLAARTIARNGDYSSDLRLWSQTVRVAQTNPRAWTNLGMAFVANGQNTEAENCYRLALAQDSVLHYDHFALFNLGMIRSGQARHEEAARCFAGALEASPNWAEAHNNLGYSLMQLGKWRESLEQFQRAIELKPCYAGAQLNYGLACWRLNDPRSALAHVEQARECDPRDPQAHLHFGRMLLEQGRAAEARAPLEQAIALAPTLTIAEDMLASVWRQLGNYQAAAQHRERAARGNPHDPLIQVDWALDSAASGDLVAARTRIDAVLRKHPQFVEAHLAAGDMALVARQFDAALKSYSRAAELAPQDYRPFWKAAKAHLAFGNRDAALRSARQAADVANRPEIAQFIRRLGSEP